MKVIFLCAYLAAKFRKLVNRLDKSFAFRLNNIPSEREERRRHDFSIGMQEVAYLQTVDYVMANMVNAVVHPSQLVLFDYVFHPSFIEGLYCEFSVFSGSTINYMAGKINETIHSFDSFEGLPEYRYGDYGKEKFNWNGHLPPVEQTPPYIKDGSMKQSLAFSYNIKNRLPFSM